MKDALKALMPLIKNGLLKSLRLTLINNEAVEKAIAAISASLIPNMLLSIPTVPRTR